MSGSGKGLLGLWLYRSGESEWAVKEGSPIHNEDDLVVRNESNFLRYFNSKRIQTITIRMRVSSFFYLFRKTSSGSANSSSTSTLTSAKRSDKIIDKTSIIFTLNNQVGGLARALQVFQELGINVLHLELQNTRSDVDQVGHIFSIHHFYAGSNRKSTFNCVVSNLFVLFYGSIVPDNSSE